MRLPSTITVDRALLEQALSVLEKDVQQATYAGGVRICNLAIDIRAALAAPGRRLTDEEAINLFRQVFMKHEDPLGKNNLTVAFARAIEAAHGIGETK